MAAVYTLDGNELCAGLRGCDGDFDTDEAICAAQRHADWLGVDVVLDDDDGCWIVHPIDQATGRRKLADPDPEGWEDE